MNLDRRARRIGRLFQLSAQAQSRTWLITRLVLVVGGVTLVAVAQFLDTPDEGLAWNKLIGWVGAGLAFAGGVLDLLGSRQGPMALEEARRGLEDARHGQAEVHDMRREIAERTAQIEVQYERLLKLLGVINVLRESAERAIAYKTPVEDDLERLLKMICRPLLGALGCDGDERWTLNIYRKEGRALRGVASLNADRSGPAGKLREWAAGEGFVGACFSSEHEIVLKDAQSPEARRILHVSTSNRRDDDAVRYKSVAAIPVRVAGRPQAWGVVIATSDRVGRFDDDADSLGAVAAQAIRGLAGATALIVAGQKSRRGSSRNGNQDLSSTGQGSLKP